MKDNYGLCDGIDFKTLTCDNESCELYNKPCPHYTHWTDCKHGFKNKEVTE